jgi:5'-nucleotidase
MNTLRKSILVDQDGVLANYQEHLLALWENEHPHEFRLPLHAVTEHDISVLFPQDCRDELEAITLRKGFFLSLPPIAGGKDALEEMLAMGHDVRICTSPKKIHRHCVPEKFAWVEEHLGGKWVDRIVLTRDKTLVCGDILIDDKPDIVGICTPSWKHLLYDQPYNRHITTQPRLTWVNYRKVLGL